MMAWIPRTCDLELLCEHAVAKMPAAVTARVLGVEVEDLRELADRLARGRAHVILPPEPPEVLKQSSPQCR